jgi:hypothetical protein
VELSSLFNHNGTWATGMIHNSNTALWHSSRIGSRRPNLVNPGLEHELVQFCLNRQRKRNPATICDVMN